MISKEKSNLLKSNSCLQCRS